MRVSITKGNVNEKEKRMRQEAGQREMAVKMWEQTEFQVD